MSYKQLDLFLGKSGACIFLSSYKLTLLENLGIVCKVNHFCSVTLEEKRVMGLDPTWTRQMLLAQQDSLCPFFGLHLFQ